MLHANPLLHFSGRELRVDRIFDGLVVAILFLRQGLDSIRGFNPLLHRRTCTNCKADASGKQAAVRNHHAIKAVCIAKTKGAFGPLGATRCLTEQEC